MSKANLVTPRTLAGFMELMPRDQLAFERIRQALEETYALYGFYPLEQLMIGFKQKFCSIKLAF